MPGVPPDALGQVKKGIRGLFNRRKQKQQQQQQQGQPEATPTSSHTPTKTTTAAAPAPVAAAAATDPPTFDDGLLPPPPQPASASTFSKATDPPNRSPHISEPAKVEEARAVDLNPAPAAAKAEHSAGMSATSGPLGDPMMGEEYSDDIEGNEGAQSEKGAQEHDARSKSGKGVQKPDVAAKDYVGPKDELAPKVEAEVGAKS